jgi:hypothetical protein
MARVFQLPEDVYEVKNKNDEVVLSAPLLDLYYLMAYTSEDPAVSQLDNYQKSQHIASVVNQVYGSKLTGGQITSVFIDLTEAVEASKKNITS